MCSKKKVSIAYRDAQRANFDIQLYKDDSGSNRMKILTDLPFEMDIQYANNQQKKIIYEDLVCIAERYSFEFNGAISFNTAEELRKFALDLVLGW